MLLSILTLASVVIYGRAVVLPASRAHTHGFAAYYTAAHLLLRSPEKLPKIYDDDWFSHQIQQVGLGDVHDIFNIQPPTMSLMLLPLAGLGVEVARAVWVWLHPVFLAGGLVFLASALGGRWFHGLWLLPACLLFIPVTRNIQYGQAYLFLFLLLSIVFFSVARSSPLHSDEPVAGGALGLMLALKTGGVWLWPLLAWVRQWRILLWALAIAIGVVLISLPFIGLTTWANYLAALPMLAVTPKRYVTAYQTVTSLWGHLFVFDAQWNPGPVANLPWLASTLTLTTQIIALMFSAVWSRWSNERLGQRMLSLALFVVLSVPNTPFAEDYHYCLVLPALIVASWWAYRERSPWWMILWLAGAALLLGARWIFISPRLTTGWMAVLAYPRLLGAYLLWGWLGLSLTRSPASNIHAPMSKSCQPHRVVSH